MLQTKSIRRTCLNGIAAVILPVPTLHAYADEGRIAGYAKSSIQAVTDNGLMQGSEANGRHFFHPEAATSREAAASVINALLLKAGLING